MNGEIRVCPGPAGVPRERHAMDAREGSAGSGRHTSTPRTTAEGEAVLIPENFRSSPIKTLLPIWSVDELSFFTTKTACSEKKTSLSTVRHTSAENRVCPPRFEQVPDVPARLASLACAGWDWHVQITSGVDIHAPLVIERREKYPPLAQTGRAVDCRSTCPPFKSGRADTSRGAQSRAPRGYPHLT